MNDLNLICKMEVKDEYHDDVIEQLGILLAATRKEEGCLYYNFFRSTDEPQYYFVFEHWTSKVALDNHMSSAHFIAFTHAVENKMIITEINRLKALFD